MKMKNHILIGVIVVAVIIIGYFVIQNQQKILPPKVGNIESAGCVIENPDPDGYLLKICKYLRAHEDTIDISPADPTKYNIKSIEEGEYSRWEGNEQVTTEAIIIRLDCCYMGDIAYIDKATKEVIGFSPGDR